jgi:riboflavin transporter FmnP
MGPLSGLMVCLVKNLINLMFSTTGGVGELSNFVLGCAFVVPAGLIYRRNKTKRSALIGALAGAVIMAVFSVFSNYFIVYPVYTMFMPMEAIIAMYQAIYPGVDNLLEALIIFNMPFTFIKGLCSVVITFIIYKHISPIIKGTNR